MDMAQTKPRAQATPEKPPIAAPQVNGENCAPAASGDETALSSSGMRLAFAGWLAVFAILTLSILWDLAVGLFYLK
jgi:hypothetical protein